MVFVILPREICSHFSGHQSYSDKLDLDLSEAPGTPNQVTAMTELAEETPERRIIRSHEIVRKEDGVVLIYYTL